MAKKRVSADELIWIFNKRLAELAEYGRRIPIAVILIKGGWLARTNARSKAQYPGCTELIERLETELRENYHLTRNQLSRSTS